MRFLWFGRRRTADVRSPSPSRFAWLGSRRYDRAIPYALPQDGDEISRLDFQHFLLRNAMRSNYLAPLTAPKDILDVGTGTGRWALEMAARFPDANVVGTDVTASTTAEIGFGLTDIPRNYMFLPANVLERLPFADNSFDYVHMRLLFLAIPADRWQSVINELVRVTRPRGWVELLEASTFEQRGPAAERMLGWLLQVLGQRNINIYIGKQLGPMLQQAGLANVQTQILDLPLGAHGGRLGKMVETDILTATQGIKPLMIMSGAATAETFDREFTALQHEAATLQMRYPFYAAYGQKLTG